MHASKYPPNIILHPPPGLFKSQTCWEAGGVLCNAGCHHLLPEWEQRTQNTGILTHLMVELLLPSNVL